MSDERATRDALARTAQRLRESAAKNGSSLTTRESEERARRAVIRNERINGGN